MNNSNPIIRLVQHGQPRFALDVHPPQDAEPIRAAIADRLKGYGLGHLPTDLPQYQWDEVRLYQLGTPLEKVIKAVTEPSELGDQVLMQVVDTDAQQVLAQIRELVCG